jgi:RNA polymerase sigma-B factor
VAALIREYRHTGDLTLRDRLVSDHHYLLQAVARKFAGLGESHDDLLQEGAMGLLNAVELYDPDRKVQFSTYATHLVEGQIRHYLRDRGKLIKQPAWVQELTTKIIKASDALAQELDRTPTPEEIAQRIGTAADTVTRMLQARERSKVASLDAAREDDESGSGAPAIDPEKLQGEEAHQVHLPVEDRIFLRDAIARLKELERKVVHHFYYLDLNQTEIARKLGISVNYASYLLRGAVAKLKQAYQARETREAGEAWPAEETRVRSGAYSMSMRPAPADPLTKLPTEGHFLDRLGQELARAARYPQQFSVLLVEPDPPWGDQPSSDSLAALARLIRANVRSIDLVARLSGCRFGLLLPHTGRQSAVLGERIVQTVGRGRSLSSSEANDAPPQLSPTLSIGLAIFPADGDSLESLLSSAETALITAREQGGCRCLRCQPPGQNGPRPSTAPA